MASSNILREFLIAIGFDVDQESYRDFDDKFKKINAQFVSLGKVALETGAALAVALTATASKLTNLYFASEQAGTSVRSLMAIRFAGSQIGVDAEHVSSLLTGLASQIRSNIGARAEFQQYVGKAFNDQDSTQSMIDLLTKLKELRDQGLGGQMFAINLGQEFGMDEPTLKLFLDNLPALTKFITEFKQRGGGPAFDQSQFAEWAKFQQDIGKLWASIELLGIKGFLKLLPMADNIVNKLQAAVDWFSKLDDSTRGWASSLAVVATTMGGIAASFAALRTLGGLFGMGAAAGGAGELAAGGGILSTLLGTILSGPAIALIVAAVGAYLLAHNWEAVKSGASKAWNSVAGAVGVGGEDAKSLALSMIENFEKFRASVYADVTGKGTVGYGHQVRPGEDFSGGLSQNQAQLLAIKDMQSAMQSVLALVKVSLTSGQLAALTDLTYNIGAGNFAQSTLLKKLNAGDYAGAAEALDRLNHAGGREYAGLTARRQAEKGVFQQTTNINVNGADNPQETARTIGKEQIRVNADLLRNGAGVMQ